METKRHGRRLTRISPITLFLLITFFVLLPIFLGAGAMAQNAFDQFGVATPAVIQKVVVNELRLVNFGVDIDDYSLLETRLFKNILGEPQAYVLIFAKNGLEPDAYANHLKRVFKNLDFSSRKKEDPTFPYNAVLTESRQENYYLFVIAGATTKRFPIIEVWRGLPTYVYFANIYRSLAQERFGPAISFTGKMVFSGHRNFWINFTALDGRSAVTSYFINATDHNIITEEQLIALESDASHPQKPFQMAVEEQKAAQWREKLSDSQNVKATTQKKIEGVPNWAQVSDDCAPNSATNLLGYYDSHPYKNLYYCKLIDDVENEYFDLTIELRQAMGWVNGNGTPVSNIANGIKQVCNNAKYYKEYKYKTDLDDIWPTFGTLKKEINAGRPIMYGTIDHPYYKNHAMVAVGYIDGETDYVTVHNSWGSETDVVWGDHTGWTVEVVPGGGSSACFYNEDFEDKKAQGWKSDHPEDWKVLASKVYRASMPSPPPGNVFTMVSTYRSQKFANFSYEIRIKRAGYLATYMVFRATEDFDGAPILKGTGYAFGICTNPWLTNHFYILKVIDGVITPIVGWVKSDYIKTGSAWNKLKVEAEGASFKFYINNSLVYTMTDDSIANGRIGLLGATSSDTVTYENKTYSYLTTHFFDDVKVAYKDIVPASLNNTESITPLQQNYNNNPSPCNLLGISPGKDR